MPNYIYQCPKCPESRVIISRKIDDEERVPVCVACAAEMKRDFAILNTTFKGSGFYSTDK